MSNQNNIYKLTLYSNIYKTVLSTIFSVISVPITLHYFGVEKYGIWSIINTIVTYLSISNFGLDSASSILINKNVSVISKIQIFNKTKTIAYILVPAIVLILFIFNFLFPDWLKYFRISEKLYGEAKISLIIMVLFSIFTIPLSLYASIINGFQRNYIENYFSILILLLQFIVLLLTVHLNKSLIFLAININLVRIIIFIIKLFYVNKILIKEELKVAKSNDSLFIHENSYKVIAITGYRCMLGSIASMLILNLDNILIAKYVGLDYVAEYTITFKIFTLFFSLVYIINSSLVPLIGKKITDYDYINSIFNFNLYIVTIFSGFFLFFILGFGQLIIEIWVGKQGYAGLTVLSFLGAYGYLFSLVNLNYVLINTLNFLKGIAFLTITEGLFKFLFSVILVKNYGIGGVAAGTFFGTLFSTFIFFPIILKNRSNKLIIQNSKFLYKHIFIVIIPCLILFYIVNMNINSRTLALMFSLILCCFYLFASYLILSNHAKNKIMIKIMNFKI